jgi:hypothetical protein
MICTHVCTRMQPKTIYIHVYMRIIHTYIQEHNISTQPYYDICTQEASS